MGGRTGRHTPYYDEDQLTTQELIFIQNLAFEANYDSTVVPLVSTGSGAPVTTPDAIGSIYVDTLNDNIYMAVGTTNSADWIQVDGGGGAGTLQAVTDLGNTTTNDIEITDTTKGVILKSPDGTRWRITITNNGELVATSL